jgi:hypothetical protein
MFKRIFVGVIGLVVVGLMGTSTVVFGQQFNRVQIEFFNQYPGFFYNIGWGDYDDDGYLDFLISNGLDAPNFLFRNLGDGTFERKADTVIEQDSPASGASVIWGDYDNDGDLDLFVSNYHAGGKLQHPNSPYHEIYKDVENLGYDFYHRNEGDGSFTKITEGELVTTITDAYGSQSVAFDYDNDGFLDLFVGSSYDNENFLFHNNGDGTMAEVGGAIRPGMWEAHGATTLDYDDDGFLELIVTGQEDMQFDNVDGTLELGPLKKGPDGAWGPVAGDFDNDGDMDLVVAGPDNKYFENVEGVLIEKTGVGIHVEDNVTSVGAWAADYDNDGYLDLYFTNHLGANNFLYHNDGDGTFTQIFTEIMTYDGGFGWAAPWADYDNDGDMDLIVADGTIWPDEYGPYPIRFYINNGNANNWVTFRLEGTVSNRDAVGAKIRIRAIVDGQPLEQMREISTSQGSGSQSDMRPHFGLGDATIVDSVSVEWPSGILQEFYDVPVKQFHDIVEQPNWAGYPYINDQMDVDTGDWMGILNAAHAPWIWCYEINSWIYMDAIVGHRQKGWMYICNKDDMLMQRYIYTPYFYCFDLDCWFNNLDVGHSEGWMYQH